MKNQFADYELSKMLKTLGFAEDCIAYHSHNVLVMEKASFTNMKPHWENTFLAPLWQQVEEWLWNNHKISIETERVSIHAVLYKVRVYQYIDNEPGLIQYLHFESPITCKIEGIKTAVKHLSETAVAVTPNNTKPNSH